MFKEFKDGVSYILVATDVASRGLGKVFSYLSFFSDVKDIKYVINYDMPF